MVTSLSLDFERPVDPCKRHTWALQLVSIWLWCDRCGRALDVTRIEPWRRSAIIRRLARTRGRRYADGLNHAIAETQRQGRPA